MKYCYACGNTTGGEPLFCNSCGLSYDVKFCPKLHVNPRLAEACSQCGIRDLSVPQPRVPVRWRSLAILVQAVVGLVLLCPSLTLIVAFLRGLAPARSLPSRPLILGVFFVSALWGLWTQLPDVFRRIIRRSLLRKSGFVRDRNHL